MEEDTSDAPSQTDNTAAFFVQSKSFNDGEKFPVKYCNKGVVGGTNTPIQIEWRNVPKGTKSLFLVLVDTHSVANDFIHWAVKDIDPTTNEIPESGPVTNGVELKNSDGAPGYFGPQPPAGTGDHPYEVHLFALSTAAIDIPEQADWEKIQSTLAPVTLEEAKFTGLYGR